jgi:predicted peroxiredoxin
VWVVGVWARLSAARTRYDVDPSAVSSGIHQERRCGALGGLHADFQEPAVRVLEQGFTAQLSGWSWPFSHFARNGMARAGRHPPQDKLAQMRELGEKLYVCGPSMDQVGVERSRLAYPDVVVSEYAVFLEAMVGASIAILLQQGEFIVLPTAALDLPLTSRSTRCSWVKHTGFGAGTQKERRRSKHRLWLTRLAKTSIILGATHLRTRLCERSAHTARPCTWVPCIDCVYHGVL